jgi:hypothetical protein
LIVGVSSVGYDTGRRAVDRWLRAENEGGLVEAALGVSITNG